MAPLGPPVGTVPTIVASEFPSTGAEPEPTGPLVAPPPLVLVQVKLTDPVGAGPLPLGTTLTTNVTWVVGEAAGGFSLRNVVTVLAGSSTLTVTVPFAALVSESVRVKPKLSVPTKLAFGT